MSGENERDRKSGGTSFTGEDGWWRRPFSVFQTNLQEIDATMDVEQTLDRIEAQGATTWLINTGGISSFYPTDLPYQTRNPFLADRPSGDLIGDAVAAAKRRGIKVLSRLDFSKVSPRIAKEHPEWLFVSPKGEPQIYNTLYSTCPNRDYYQNRSLDILDEVIDRYPIDGFFFNWFDFSEMDYSRVYHGVCSCNVCQERFATYSGGKELPDGPGRPNYAQWLSFANDVVTTLCAKISDHISARRPDAALVLKRGAPIVYYEANNAFGREPWHHNTSENVGAHMTGLPEISLLVNSVSFIDMPYRMSGEQPEMFAQYLLQAIARGGNPSTYIMGAPGRIPYANLPVAGQIQCFHRNHHEIYRGLRPASNIALVRPDPVRRAEPGYAQNVSEFRGLFSGLTERNLPFDVVAVECISKIAEEGRLSQFQMIILPDLGQVGSDTASALDAYVAAGGNVVLTGGSAITDEGEGELATGPAIMRAGNVLTGSDLWSTFVTDAEQTQSDAFCFAPRMVAVYGTYANYVWKPRAEKMGRLAPQAPFGPPEKCYGHILSDHPAAVRLINGGSVTQFPWTIGHTYREFGTTEIRDFFLDCVADLATPTVTAELPDQVEIVVGRSDAGLVIHLINQSGMRTRSVGPHLPISGGVLRIKDGVGPARLLKSDKEIEGQTEDGALVLELPELGLYEVVVLPEAAQ
ncbi:alpha-amylase family protein [Thalassospira lucentensis]|uniref:alpha-amylase family protein n=1 Tax=Thalassospira lucentensis TaxID=168935 RepID=UPI0003B4C4EC|nr:alpha-amylase family protein [Thalassospira lucentensis]